MKHFETGNNQAQSKPRSYVLLKIDLKMIAEARGVSKKTVTRAIKAGKLNPADLMSIARYITG